jgi:hypothetical protein
MSGWLARLLGTGVLVVALAGVALADDLKGRGRGRGRGHDDGGPTTSSGGPVQAPEIDLSSGINALALLAGGLIVIRGRRRAKGE